jgi:Fe-S cluster biogenesis protein NfuA
MDRKKVTYDDAVARARKAGFEPAFSKGEWQGTAVNGKRVKYPWTHQKCGETRPQQFHDILKGRCGGCHSRGRKKMTYDDAVARARAAGFTPAFSTDEWQGTQQVKYPWTHLKCGETRPQTFHSMLKGTCGACHSGGKEKTTYDEAVARARKAGFKPAFSKDEWQGTWANGKRVKYPWTHQKCGETRPQQFHNMLKGRCGACGPKPVKVSYDDAVARARKAGFKPAFPRDEWQGTQVNGKHVTHPWTHQKCGETRPQEFHNMLKGRCGGCHSQGGQKMTYDEVVERARKAGFKPAFPEDEWQGTWANGKQVKYPWTHQKCGKTRPQRFGDMLKGTCGGCGPKSVKVSYDDAVARALKAGFKPAFPRDEWQGTAVANKYPWTHQKCGETRPQQFGSMLKGTCGGCSKVSYDEVVERARKAGFEAAFPRDEWQGTRVNGKQVKYPWTHLKCGETRPQTFHSMLKGTCGGCNSAPVSYDEAVARARKAGFEAAFPRDEWQGTAVNGKNVKYPWTHQKCGETRPQMFHNMLNGACGGCYGVFS